MRNVENTELHGKEDVMEDKLKFKRLPLIKWRPRWLELFSSVSLFGVGFSRSAWLFNLIGFVSLVFSFIYGFRFVSLEGKKLTYNQLQKKVEEARWPSPVTALSVLVFLLFSKYVESQFYEDILIIGIYPVCLFGKLCRPVFLVAKA